MKRSAVKAKLLTGMAAIVLLAVGGCVYTWRPYWWNFYRRGLSRASEGQLQQAADDFEIAAGKKSGATVSRPKDARRVRTYGMHFIVDYFPHRELGVAYYRMNRFDEAEKELLTSLAQTPSAKAKMYLNLARRELLRKTPAQDDPPALVLNIPHKPYLNSDTVRLTGTAESKNYVSSIFVSGERLFVELAEQRIEFSRDLKLKPGANNILVEAIDLIGKSSREELVLKVDMQYPAVGIEDAVRKGPDTVGVSGVATDNVGVSELIVEGRRQAIARPSTEITFSLDAAPGDTITVKVTDLAGNTTSARVAISADMIKPGEGGSRRPVMLAMRSSGRVLDSGVTGLLLSQMVTPEDRTRPVITIRNVVDNRIIYDDKLIFDVEVRDYGGVASLSVNGENILGRRTGALVKYCTYRADLIEGVNRFKIVVIDRAGNRAEKSFQVLRKIQEPLRVGARLTLALLDLRASGSAQLPTSQIYDLLLGSFLRSERFNFVERGSEAFEAILRELKIGTSPLADPTRAVRPGRIRAAEGILFGKTFEDERSITITLELVDTETSEIVFFADVYGEDKSRDELKWLVDGLVLKCVQHFPLVRGKVTQVTDSGVFIDNGLLDGIWAGMKYLILREDQGDFTGALRTIRVNGKALEAKVRTVQPQSCFAAFPDKNGAPPVKVNDPVITK